MSDFVHLHCHTEFSLLDGTIKINDLFAKASEFGLQAAAITDHGNLFGAIQFYTTAKEFGIKPIIGCEVYVAPEHRTIKQAKSAGDAGYHLVLLAQNAEGYHNLIKLVSRGFIEGFYYKPRIDKELLAQFNQGLIAMSACLKGEIPSTLRNQSFHKAKEKVKDYTSLFPNRFYLELQDNDIPDQDEVNAKLLDLSRQENIPVVATNDCHYLMPDDVEAHDILLCIQTNACVSDQKRMRFNTEKLYYRSPEEMEQAFSHCPEAIDNTKVIADSCNVEIELGRHHFPVYSLPPGKSIVEEFSRMAKEGLQERLKQLPYQIDENTYWQRLEKELEIIGSKGFAGYFLIVQDFINWAKSKGIPVGPGRGSAAGSLVAYSLKITNLDPIRYNLLFERFLNAERESLPDIDVDFCYNRREEVIRYVMDKFGQNSVAQITTFGTMKAKAVVRDVGRALGMSFSETDKIAKLIPDGLNITIEKAIEQEPELQKKINEDQQIAKLINISKKLEGLCRHASTHAAGIVISDKPMEEYLPLYIGKKGEIVTQYDMKRVEKVGLIKFDFLGLKTLTVINDTLKLAKSNNKEIPDLDTLPLDDPAPFELLCSGQTDGVFQLESRGMRQVLMDMKPSKFEDLIALLALYRPGPLESGMVTDFIQRKHGRVKVDYPHPSLEPILKETYGVILYQEQVMRIASELADYSLGDGDILRRAMGKKDPQVMTKQRSKFLQGTQKNGLPEETANYLFDLIEKFAGYGFNKSHSAAYALISYQTANLKAHFPVEFMAALMTSEVANTDKVMAHINACREMDIDIQPPDINKSEHPFTVEKDLVRFGLSGIKNVGDGAIQNILQERSKNGPFKSLLNFCERVNLRKVSRRVVESLIKSGAMDCFGASRASLFASLERVVSVAQKRSRSQQKGQLSLLSFVQDPKSNKSDDKNTGVGLNLQEDNVEAWPEDQKLRYEKDSLGFFLSGHPLLPYKDKLDLLEVTPLKDCLELPPETEIKAAFLVTGCKEITTRKGDKMAFCQIEDLTGRAELTLFPENYKKIKQDLHLDKPFWAKSKLNENSNGESESDEGSKTLKLVVQEIGLLYDIQIPDNQPYRVHIHSEQMGQEDWQEFKEILKRYPGNNPVQLILFLDEAVCHFQLPPEFCVSPKQRFSHEVKKWQKKVCKETTT